ncbi:LamG domain-containing protein [Marinobacter panjinensis]|uniref:LamG domain-containing protein n=1 Tax=Marinobacter panjinensis TaxID=2576384 RepID=UPI001484CA07|nr:LamG domain-containing protein [Marinobacter panjinensis]MCR8916422.1 LamG domain-containing protein [Marinobacter panjinensis]
MTINEVHQLSQGSNNDRFIEIKVLSAGITAADYDGWTLSACTDVDCTGDLSVAGMDDSTYPWISAGNSIITSEDFIDLSDGMDVILKDSSGDTIDYLSVGEFYNQRDEECEPAYDWEAEGSNTKTLNRQPDGAGSWGGDSGASGETTEGNTNDGDVGGPGIDLSGATVFQGEDAIFTVTLSESASEDLRVDYQTRDDTAVAGIDYTATTGTITIASGDLTAQVTVPTRVSGSTELRRFYLSLSNARNEAGEPFGVLESQLGVGLILPEPLVTYRMEQLDWSGNPGEVLDASGNGRNATALNGATTGQAGSAIPGNPGTCRYGDFDGANDQLRDTDAGDYLNGLGAVTVMAWVYNGAQLAGNDRGIFFTDDPASGRDNRFGLRYDTAGFFGNQQNVIKASISSDDCNASEECLQVETVGNVMVRDEWQHLAMTWERGRGIKVFVDGVEVGVSASEGTGGDGLLARVGRLDIGQGAKNQRWLGRIDEFRIFGAALSAEKIDQKRRLTFPCNIGPDHIRLTHPGSGLTCSPADITVTACADEDCSTLFSDPVTVDFSSPTENWSPDPITFTETTNVLLQYTTAETVTLNAQASSPLATNPPRCFSGGLETCEMTFLDAGFIIDVPAHTSAVAAGGTIAAVRKEDTSQRCVPGFSDVTRDVALWSTYSDPSSGTEAVVIGAQPVAKASPGTVNTFDFNANGIAAFDLTYPDVGRVGLNARYDGSEANGDAGLVLIGQADFIARPDRFRLDVPGNPQATDASGSIFRTAGESFEITVSALNANGDLTPNFGQESSPESVGLESLLIAPSGGEDPPIGGGFGAFGQACDGTSAANGSACGEFNWPEVGIIALTPRLAGGSGYLGFEDVVGTRLDNVGRFIPARFELTVAEAGIVDPFCTASTTDFAYMGQSLNWQNGFEPIITVDALNAAGTVTQNYTSGDFLKLDALDLARVAGSNDNTAVDGPGNPFPVTATLAGMTLSNLGAGQVQYIFSAADTLVFDKTTDSRVAPFTPDYSIELSGLEDSDGVTASPQTPMELSPSFGFQIRYGRLNIDNAYGPETADLTVPFRADYYTGSEFVLNEADSCWVYDSGTMVSLDESGLSGGSTSVIAASDTLLVGEPPAGSELILSAPGEGNTGDVGVTFSVPDWLQGDYNDDGALENPSALATFGVYRGHDRVIYWRER